MPDERDKHPRKTPPAGVRAQTAGEIWDDDRTHPGEESLRHPPNGDQTVALRRRVRRASRAAEASVKIATAVRQDVAVLTANTSALERRVAIMGGELGDVRLQLKEIDERADDRNDKLVERLLTVLQHERETTLAIQLREVDAKLEERKADGDLRRWSTQKVIATTATIVIALATAVIAAIHC